MEDEKNMKIGRMEEYLITKHLQIGCLSPTRCWSLFASRKWEKQEWQTRAWMQKAFRYEEFYNFVEFLCPPSMASGVTEAETQSMIFPPE